MRPYFYNRFMKIDMPYCFMTIVDFYQYSDYWRDVIVRGYHGGISYYRISIREMLDIAEVDDMLQELDAETE